MAWAIDLDGVMWLGDEPIVGSAEAVARLRQAGHEVWFVTNNSSVRVSDVEAKLATHGVEATGVVLTSAVAAATLVEEGERVLVCGGPGVVEEVGRRGAEVVDPARPGPVDAVIVGLTRQFDFEMLTAAAMAVRAGARFIGTNSDPTYPTPHGQIPGGGALVAAVATAAEAEPTMAGKPNAPMVSLVQERLGPHGTMVGDRISTDGRFAVALGYRFVLVASGVTDGPPASADPTAEAGRSSDGADGLDGIIWAHDLKDAVDRLV